MCEAEFGKFYEQKFEPLCRYLKQAFFVRLNEEDCEDLAQKAFLQTWEDVQRSGRFEPGKNWWAWLRRVARNRAIDYLRHTQEKPLLDGKMPEPRDPGMSPSQVLREIERRARQTKLLSQILEEYCQDCEKARIAHRREATGGQSEETLPPKLREKTVLERTLRWQRPDEIAKAMAMKPNYVFQLRHRAQEEIKRRASRADTDKSVLDTLLGRRVQRLAMPADTASAGPGSLVAVIDLVVQELGAMCPDAPRLAEYAEHPQAIRFSDIRYHVEEARCRLCRAELDQLAAE